MDSRYREALVDAKKLPLFYFAAAFFFGLSVNLWSGAIATEGPLWWILALVPLAVIALIIFSPFLPDFLPFADRDIVTSIFIDRQHPAKGLVVFASLGGGIATARTAILAHRETLEHVWLVSSAASKKNAESLAEALDSESAFLRSRLSPLDMSDIDFDDPEAVKNLVEASVYGALPPGMTESDVVVDITGGLKTTTAGAFMAGLPRGRRLEYVVAARKNENGQGEIPGDVREIRIDYRLKKHRNRSEGH